MTNTKIYEQEEKFKITQTKTLKNRHAKKKNESKNHANSEKQTTIHLLSFLSFSFFFTQFFVPFFVK